MNRIHEALSRTRWAVVPVGLALSLTPISPATSLQTPEVASGAAELSQPAAAFPLRQPAATELRTAAPAAKATWRTVFVDNFNGSSLNKGKWSVYNGGKRRKANTFVKNGKLVLRTKKSGGSWTAAGVSSARGLKQTYGRYTMRVRMARGYGVRACGLLWPASNAWPPEVDFYEMNANDPQRTQNNLTNHYRPGHHMTHAHVRGDFLRWHEVGLWWSKDQLVYRLDGRTVSTMRSHVPRVSMWLGLQTAAGGISAHPTSSTPSPVDFQVDWVRVTHLA